MVKLTPDRLAAFVALLETCRNRPDIFVEVCLRQKPRAWQRSVCERIARRLAAGDRHLEVLIRTCHGSGKTFLAAALLLWWMTTRRNARGLTTAPTWTQVETTLWKTIAALWSGSIFRDLDIARLTNVKLDFGATWFAIGASSDRPENLEGQHSDTATIRIIDEAKEVDPKVFESTAGMLDAPETMDLWISTPSICSGPFFSRDTNGPASVIRQVVDINMLIADGVEGQAERKERALREWGEGSPTYQARVMACYVDNADSALFPSSWIERAMAQTFTAGGPRIAGLDPAGSVNGDQSALALASGPDPWGRIQVDSVIGWHERDTMISKGKALAAARDAKAKLRIDVVGLGKGVADSARENRLGIPVEEYRASDKPRDKERFANRKAEDAFALRDLLEKGLVRLPVDRTLASQMRAMRYRIDTSGRFRSVDPADSPDLADAVIIATASERFGYSACDPSWI